MIFRERLTQIHSLFSVVWLVQLSPHPILTCLVSVSEKQQWYFPPFVILCYLLSVIPPPRSLHSLVRDARLTSLFSGLFARGLGFLLTGPPRTWTHRNTNARITGVNYTEIKRDSLRCSP